MLKYRLILSTIVFSFLPLLISAQSDEIQKEVNGYIAKAPFKMPAINVPQFPDKVYNIRDFGAISDGRTLCTDAIENAIDACSKGGGGKVVIPDGLWITGAIQLKSNVNLYLATNALVHFTKDHTQYPIIPTSSSRTNYMVMSPIYGYGLENIAITGNGVFDGSGDTWRPVKRMKMTNQQWKKLVSSGGVVSSDGSMRWPTKEAMEGETYLKNLRKEKKSKLTADDFEPARDFLRPYMVVINKCKNILIDGPTFKNSPKFALYPGSSSNIIIRNVNILNEWYAQNGDGIDLSACRNVLVYKCTVNICMKSSRSGSDTTKRARLENIIIADNKVYRAHGGFVIGSNTDGGMHNIFVDNCTFIGTDIGIRIKSNRDNGGLVHQVYIQNIYMTDIVNEAILFNTYYADSNNDSDSTEYEANETTPQFTDFYLKNIYCNDAKTAIAITGLPEMPVRRIFLDDIYIDSDEGCLLDDSEDIKFNNVKVFSESNTVFDVADSKNITIENGVLPDSAKLFMNISGKGTSNIKIINTNLSRLAAPVTYGKDVPKNAVIMQ